eukprot:6213504-Pleurochrysis_carterae.AAC.1
MAVRNFLTKRYAAMHGWTGSGCLYNSPRPHARGAQAPAAHNSATSPRRNGRPPALLSVCRPRGMDGGWGGRNTVERSRSRRHRACFASGDAHSATGATYRLLGSFP